MNCRWDDYSEWDDGKRCVRCVRCGRTSAPTAADHDRIRAACRAWPFWHEFGEWLAILFAAFGLTPRRYAWLRWKLGLDEVAEGSCGGCEGRKQWLNTLGGRLSESSHWAARFVAGLLVRRHLPPKSE